MDVKRGVPFESCYSHRQPKPTYYLVQTIPFLGISKIDRNFPDCRNFKLIKCRRNWHEQIALNQCFNIFWLQNFGCPLNNLGKCANDSFLQAEHDLILKEEFPQAIPEIICLQSWPKREILSAKVNFEPQNPKRGTHNLENDLKILATPTFSPINTKKMCNWLLFSTWRWCYQNKRISTSHSQDIKCATFGCPWL